MNTNLAYTSLMNQNKQTDLDMYKQIIKDKFTFIIKIKIYMSFKVIRKIGITDQQYLIII